MAEFFGFDHLRLRKPSRLVVGADVPFEVPPVPVERKLYAFSIPEAGGPPRCLSFTDDEDGRLALARHCRSDRVVKVVYGSEVDIDRSDVVHLNIEHERTQDALPLMH